MVSSPRRIKRTKRGRNTKRKRRNSGGGNYGRGRGQDLQVLTTDIPPALTDVLHHLTTAILGQGIAHPLPTTVAVAVAVPSHTIVTERIVMAEKGTSGMTMAMYGSIRGPLTPQTRGIEAGVGVLIDIANGNVAGAGVLITMLTSAHGIAPVHVPNLLRVPNTRVAGQS